MVRERERCRSRPALSPVDGNEVDSPIPVGHEVRQLLPEVMFSYRGLDADR